MGRKHRRTPRRNSTRKERSHGCHHEDPNSEVQRLYMRDTIGRLTTCQLICPGEMFQIIKSIHSDLKRSNSPQICRFCNNTGYGWPIIAMPDTSVPGIEKQCEKKLISDWELMSICIGCVRVRYTELLDAMTKNTATEIVIETSPTYFVAPLDPWIRRTDKTQQTFRLVCPFTLESK